MNRSERLIECYGARQHEALLTELGVPITWKAPRIVGAGKSELPAPYIAAWAGVIIYWIGLDDEERERVLRRVAADPALRAIVGDLTQRFGTDDIRVTLNRVHRSDWRSHERLHSDGSGEASVGFADGPWVDERWLVSYDSTGVILNILQHDDAQVEEMPLHIAVIVQAAIEEFIRGGLLMHQLGAKQP